MGLAYYKRSFFEVAREENESQEMVELLLKDGAVPGQQKDLNGSESPTHPLHRRHILPLRARQRAELAKSSTSPQCRRIQVFSLFASPCAGRKEGHVRAMCIIE